MRERKRQDPRANQWQLANAKAQLSELIYRVEKFETPQFISKNGKDVAVVIDRNTYNRLMHSQGSLISFFKASPCPEIDIPIERSKDTPRPIDL